VLTICESENYKQKHCFILKLDKASKKQFKTNEMSTLASLHLLASNFIRRYLSDIFCTVYSTYSRTVLVSSISKYSLTFNTTSVEEYYMIGLVLSTKVE
jgi:hypothetical protein